MGDDSDILQMIVCLRDGNLKEAVEQLRAMYPEEAKKVALDIRTVTKLGDSELALQHQASAQHQHHHDDPKPKPDIAVSSSDLLSRVTTATEARHGLILLPIKCSCSAHAYNRGSIPTPDPRFAGDRGSGHPHHHPRFAGDRGSSPSAVPIGGSVP